MRRDEFVKPLKYFSIFTTLAVHLLSAIVFISLVLVFGLKNLTLPPIEPSVLPLPEERSQPLPPVSLGLQEMVHATPVPATPTLEFTATILATQTDQPTQTVTNTPTATEFATSTIAPTTQPTTTLMPQLTSTTAPAETPVVNDFTTLVASPLQAIDRTELEGIITQQFELPPAGEDSGHHGVDFGFWRRGNLTSIEGVPVISVFPGKVASAYNRIRNPYGYMVIVETPLSSLPKDFIDSIQLSEESSVPASPSNRLTCPTGFADWWDPNAQSLYVLYAHMKEPPAVKLGQTLSAGEQVGLVGNTGASSAPHLHLEMRIGPSDASFTSMGHYDSTTTDLERHNYCMWRISGEFQLFDPMQLYTTPES
jgi:murein DD-endopeptidase MepM/ murein hydrolase activator NlpD